MNEAHQVSAAPVGATSDPILETAPSPPPVPAAPPVAPPPPVEPAIPMPIVDAVTIAETCQLAGRSDLIVGFLAAAATPAEVRRQLLAAQAEASPEIASRIDPNAASPDNPLLQAVRQRLAAQFPAKP